MKSIIAALLISSVAIFAGCEAEDATLIATPPRTSGKVISKDFIPSTGQRVHQLLETKSGNSYKIYHLGARTHEMFLITLETVESGKGSQRLYYRSYYLVSPTLFGELQVGQDLDVTNNPNIKTAEVW